MNGKRARLIRQARARLRDATAPRSSKLKVAAREKRPERIAELRADLERLQRKGTRRRLEA